MMRTGIKQMFALFLSFALIVSLSFSTNAMENQSDESGEYVNSGNTDENGISPLDMDDDGTLNEDVAIVLGAGKYTTLQGAIEAAKDGDTVQLLQDIVVDNSTKGTIAGKDIILDLAGCSLTSTGSTPLSVGTNAGLTVTDSSQDAVGTINGKNYGISISGADSTVSIAGGTVIGSVSGIYVQNSRVTVNVTGGSVTATNSSGYGIGAHSGYSDAVVNITGGEVTSAYGVYISATDSQVTVSDGTVSGLYGGVYLNSTSKSSSVEVTGGTVKSTAGIQGSGIYILSDSSDVIVTGGMISGNYGVSILADDDSLLMKNGQVSGTEYGIYANGERDAVTMTGGMVTAASYGICAVGDNAEVIITGGEVIASSYYGLWIRTGSDNPVVEVSGGKITGKRRGLYIDSATALVTLTGGTFTGGDYCSVYVSNNGAVSSLLGDGYAYYKGETVSVENLILDTIILDGGMLAASDGYGTVTVAEASIRKYASIYGATLTLDGTIGVNFYVDMTDVDEIDMDSYSMKFEVNGEESIVEFDVNACRTIGGNTYYRFTCPVAAKQMADTITATLYYGSIEVKTVTYSVKGYCDRMLGNTATPGFSGLLKAMLNYGSCAQTYFGYNTDSLANASLSETDKNTVEDVTVDDLADYASVITGTLPSGMNICATLILDSSVTIRFYIDGAIDDYKFTVDGEEVTPTECTNENGKYYVDVTNIGVRQLSTVYTLGISDSSGEVYSVSYSTLSYVYSMVSDTTRTEDIQNVAKALYLYYDASTRYNNWMEN